MHYYGETINTKGQRVRIDITTGGDTSRSIDFGADGSPLSLAAGVAETEDQTEDALTHVHVTQATVHLLARQYVSDLFLTSPLNSLVEIAVDGECVFRGRVEPRAYNQDFVDVDDDLDVACVDMLGALDYTNYAGVTDLASYNAAVKRAGYRTMLDVLLGLLGGDAEIFYDGSKAINADEASRYSIFSDTSISELLFLDDDKDSVWTATSVLTEIMRYFCLHIRQIGRSFYIYSLDTVKAGHDIEWHSLTSDTVVTTPASRVAISLANAADASCSLSVGEVFNQISLTCDVKQIDTVIESPLDDKSLKPLCGNYQLYMESMYSEGNGNTALQSIRDMMDGKETTYEGAHRSKWFLRTYTHNGWRFPIGGSTSEDVVTKYGDGGVNQHEIPVQLYMQRKNIMAALMAFGEVEKKGGNEDNAPISKVSMTPYLVVSVNGNGIDDESATFPKSEDILRCAPVAVYEGNKSGGAFSPADSDTTNYIVVGGNIIMNPVTDAADTNHTVPCRENSDGRFLCRRWYTAHSFRDTPKVYDHRGITPFTDDDEQLYEYSWSEVGESKDKVSKVAVLSCMLIIGDKCVVETGTEGKISDYKWRRYKTREECSSDEEYYAQSFTIGFDPKHGDKLIGTKFSIQNNIDYTLCIDAEGTAIPIRRDDHLSGQVRFMILGPVDTLWDDVTRRHGTFWRHTSWNTNTVPLLAHTESIMLENFKIEIYSDNALENISDDSDLVYVSDTDETFYNKKDDIEFKITSALTSAERKLIGISESANLSTPTFTASGDVVTEIYDRYSDTMAKPEQIYVDRCYHDLHLPRVELDINLENVDITPFTLMSHPALNGKTFYPLMISRHLADGTTELKIKEADI